MKLDRITHQFKSKWKATVHQITKARVMKFINDVYFYGADDEAPERLDPKKRRA